MKKVPLGEYDDNYSLKILIAINRCRNRIIIQYNYYQAHELEMFYPHLGIDLVAGLLIPGFLPGVILAIDNGLDTYFTFRRISQISVGAENAMKKCRCR